VGNLVFEGVPEIPAEVERSLRRYQNVRPASFAGWSTRGVLVETRFGETTQVHEVREPGGARRQLTFFDEPVAWVSVSPRGDRFAFGQDEGGDEQHQGYLYDLQTHEITRYTEEGTRNGPAVWSADGTQIAWYRATSAEPDWDILKAVVGSPVATREVILEGDGAMFPLSFSPRKRSLLVGRYTSITSSERFLLELRGDDPALTQVDVGEDVAWVGGEMIDERRFIAISDKGSEFKRLVRVNAKTGRLRVLDPDTKWNVEAFDVAPNRRRVAYAINAGGASELYVLNLRSRRVTRGPRIGMGVLTSLGFSPDGRKVGFGFSGATAPGDVWSFAVRSPQVDRWTEGEVGGLDRDLFVSPDIIEVKSGTVSVPAFVYRPEGEGPHPVVVDIHGGPEAQERPYFSPTLQYWVNELGVAVVAPNVRGSAGYGREYVKMDNGLNRMKSVEDIGKILDWVKGQTDLDEERVVVYGGSYGGFMVLASMIAYGERLAGGVDIVGISDFATFLENTKGYRRELRRAEYGDERDPEVEAFFAEISPLRNAEEITKPLFVVQGKNDPRVPESEAEQILEAVRSHGGEAWYLLAKDEGHGFQKKSNRAALREAVVVFLRDVLKLED
jgi:dipeptidyl aminopeptidase/acylaminoacyl peptidase